MAFLHPIMRLIGSGEVRGSDRHCLAADGNI
jgi:hypothetical protein